MKPFYYHLFVACVEAEKDQAYDHYVLDEENNNPLFLRELGITDFAYENEVYNYGMEVLDVDFRYEFPISELFKFSVVKKEDFGVIENFCEVKKIVPNSYIILYKKGLKLPKEIHLSFQNIFYVGEFEMSEQGKEGEMDMNPHLFEE